MVPSVSQLARTSCVVRCGDVISGVDHEFLCVAYGVQQADTAANSVLTLGTDQAEVQR